LGEATRQSSGRDEEGLDCFAALAMTPQRMVLRSIISSNCACVAHAASRKPLANNLMKSFEHAEEGNRPFSSRHDIRQAVRPLIPGGLVVCYRKRVERMRFGAACAFTIAIGSCLKSLATE